MQNISRRHAKHATTAYRPAKDWGSVSLTLPKSEYPAWFDLICGVVVNCFTVFDRIWAAGGLGLLNFLLLFFKKKTKLNFNFPHLYQLIKKLSDRSETSPIERTRRATFIFDGLKAQGPLKMSKSRFFGVCRLGGWAGCARDFYF